MNTLAKSVAWTLTVAAAHLVFLLGWTLAIGIGGALWFTVSFALIDWITGVAQWQNEYAAHLGQIASSLMTGLTVPTGAAVAAWRFAKGRSRTFNLYGLNDGSRIAIRFFCFAVAGLLIVVPLYLAGGEAFRAFSRVLWGGTVSDDRWSVMLRGLPLLLFVMAATELARGPAAER